MTTTTQLTATNGRPLVSMKSLVPSAAKQLRDLPPEDLVKTIEGLARPIRPDECELVTQLAKYRVSHFGIRGTRTAVRVSFRMFDGEACVVHVGTHAEFDRFACTYSGNVPQRFLSLEETLAMLKSGPAIRVNGHTTTASVQPSIAPISKGSDIRDCLQLLSDALLDAVDQRTSQRSAQLSEELAGVSRSLTAHCDDAVQKLSQRAAEQEQSLTAAREQWLRRGAETSTQLGDLATRITRTSSQIDHARDKLTATLTTRGEQITELQGRLDALSRDTEGCLAELTSSAQAQEVLTATQVAAVTGAVSAAQSQLAGVLNKQQQFEGHLAEVQAAFRAWVAAQNRNTWSARGRRLTATIAGLWNRLGQTVQTVVARLPRRKPSPQL